VDRLVARGSFKANPPGINTVGGANLLCALRSGSFWLIIFSLRGSIAARFVETENLRDGSVKGYGSAAGQ
jgi:hypothetical protein